jgi:hypothetical protein
VKLKLETVNGIEYAVVKDGHPVYVHSDGKEVPFDASGTLATIKRLNGEAQGHRERAETADERLKLFGDLDPVKAREAIETVGKIDAKKLIDSGQVDQVRAEAKKAYDDQLTKLEEKYKPVVKKAAQLEAALVAEKIGGSFARSPFIAEKMAIPADIVQARFGDAFKLIDGKIVAHGKDDKPLYSRINGGEIANFDEALEILVDDYPYRDSIMKGTGASGGGSNGGAGSGGKKTLTRTQFNTMDPIAQRAHFKTGGTVVDAA